jgi:hypothetical protein
MRVTGFLVDLINLQPESAGQPPVNDPELVALATAKRYILLI